jgi:hypothetical protein
MQGAWHFPNMLPTMVHDQAFPIRTYLLILSSFLWIKFNFFLYYIHKFILQKRLMGDWLLVLWLDHL